MSFFIAPYTGSGRTTEDPFRPRTDQPYWAAIDLRRDVTRQEGRCLLWAPEREAGLTLLADGKDELLAATTRHLLGLQGARFNEAVANHLIYPTDGRKPLRRSSRRGAYRIGLGPGTFWEEKNNPGFILAALAAGQVTRRQALKYLIAIGAAVYLFRPRFAHATTLTENFNTADSATLGPTQTWAEDEGNINIVGNRAQLVTQPATARATANLATDDHYSQVKINSSLTNAGTQGVMCRKAASSTITHYLTDITYASTDQQRLFRCVTGTFTALATAVNVTANATTQYLIRIEADGSLIDASLDGVAKFTDVTDTNITGNLQAGIRAGNPGAATVQWDDWEAGDLAVILDQSQGVFLQ